MHRPLPDGRARDHSRARPRRLTCLCVAAPVSKASVIAVLVNQKFPGGSGYRCSHCGEWVPTQRHLRQQRKRDRYRVCNHCRGSGRRAPVRLRPILSRPARTTRDIGSTLCNARGYFSREFECCQCREIGETHPPGMLAIRHDHPAALGARLRRKLGWRGIGGRGGAAMKARIGSFLIWTFLSPQQSNHSDDGRDHAANQHPYCLVGR
jgi:DNA-directed RNA polymerase subunit RPC12/RpoP